MYIYVYVIYINTGGDVFCVWDFVNGLYKTMIETENVKQPKILKKSLKSLWGLF